MRSHPTEITCYTGELPCSGSERIFLFAKVVSFLSFLFEIDGTDSKICVGRVEYRHRFRALLAEAAEKAIKSGARPTALQYYESCLALMQPEPWKEGAPDAYYDETLSLYTKAAELYWHQDRVVEAQNLLDSIFAGARTASDKAPAWILQSKLFAQAGNMAGSFSSLKTSLLELGLDISDSPTWASCDEDCQDLRKMVQKANFADITSKALDADCNMVALGAVLMEAISAAFWSNSILVCWVP